MRAFRGMFALAALMATPLLAMPAHEPLVPSDGGYAGNGRSRRGKGQGNKRGKGRLAKARKRPNRLTISKRVRRKHRRAA